MPLVLETGNELVELSHVPKIAKVVFSGQTNELMLSKRPALDSHHQIHMGPSRRDYL